MYIESDEGYLDSWEATNFSAQLLNMANVIAEGEEAIER